MNSKPTCKLERTEEINLCHQSPGRPITLAPEEEDFVLSISDNFINIRHPMTRSDIAYLVEDVLMLLPQQRRDEIPFRNNRPSPSWVQRFIYRYPEYKIYRTEHTENERVNALKTEFVGTKSAVLMQ